MNQYFNILSRMIPCVVMFFAYGSYIRKIAVPIFGSKLLYFLTLGAASVIQCMVTFVGNPVLTMVSLLCLMLIVTLAMYDGKKRLLLFYMILFYIYVVLLDMISIPILNLYVSGTVQSTLNSPKKFFVSGIIVSILIVCTFKIFAFVIRKPKLKSIEIRQLCFTIILAIVELGSIYGIIQQIKESSSGKIIVWIFMGFLLLDIFIVYIFEWVEERQRLELHVSLLTLQKEMMEHYHNDLEARYKESRKALHDIKKHLQVLESMAGISNSYYLALTESIDKLGYRFWCENMTMNIIINDKLSICENKRIDFDIQYTDANLSILDEMDLTIIFANLLENAIEECDNLEQEKSICLKISEHQNHLLFQITNSYDTSRIFTYLEGISTKTDHMGIGLSNVKACVEKYNGNIKFVQEESVFCVNIVIPISK